jgi:dTDP-4-dehydrorhamnose reductase
MRVLVVGETGQVARELIRRAPAGVEVTAYGRDVMDLTDPQTCGEVVMDADCDVVINAAAWTAVDAAEADPKGAMVVNAAAPVAMARGAAAGKRPFLQISTDYVFDGQGEAPFAPDAATRPLGVYGRTKMEGEWGVRAAGGPHAILRTSWVFAGHGRNFVRTMLRLGAERPLLRVVADQAGGPTPAAAIADALFVMARGLCDGAPSGTWHLSGAPDATWADFARAIIDMAGLPARVEDIATADYPTPAQRPMNSRLDCATLLRDFGIARPDWRAALPGVIAELRG